MRWSRAVDGERIVGGDMGEQRHGEPLLGPAGASNSAVTMPGLGSLPGASQVASRAKHLPSWITSCD